MSKTISLTSKNSELWQSYQDLKSTQTMLFPTEGAEALNVSEFELMLASPASRYIGTNCKDVLLKLEDFGRVESIVRNKLAVHEKTDQYHNLKLGEKMGIALNVGGLDLRFFMWKWKHMLAVNDKTRDGKPSYSIQFYDSQGAAIDKVYLRDLSEQSVNNWETMIQKQIDDANINELELDEKEKLSDWSFKQLSQHGVDELHKGWLEMTDVHQFHWLLNKLDVDRASSYRQAPQDMTQQLNESAVEELFNQVRDKQCPIMIFVGNTGLVQIQTGTIQTLKRIGDWFNILDKKHNDFTLHLKDKALAQVWCIKRPTKDGIVTSIEGFDEFGVSIFSVFGERSEGTPELELWKNIVSNVVSHHSFNETDEANSQNSRLVSDL